MIKKWELKMTNQSLFSAPEEEYSLHIKRCLESFNIVIPLFLPTLKRVFNLKDDISIKEHLEKMIIFHDLGKLTKKWQNNIVTKRKLPSHAPFGAAYLFKTLQAMDDLKHSVVFAILIHHTDRGLRGDNTERPDVQAINDGVVNFDGSVVWHENVKNLENTLFPKDVYELNITDLKQMARTLRIWSLGTELLVQHQRRMQTSLVHHILKLCDISASKERKEYQKEDESELFGGWLMASHIEKYVKSIKLRMEQ